MAVPGAVAFLRQVQGVVDSPELLKENNCIDEVVAYLDSTLDHPDSRARLGAARALARLAAQLDSKDRGGLKLHHAPKVFEQLQSTSSEEDAELHSLLATVLGDKDGQSHKVVEKLANDLPRALREVVHLTVHVDMDEAARTAVRQALVQLEGVVSVTFELDVSPQKIIVGARSELVSDPAFVEDICTTAEKELNCLRGTEHGKALVVPASYDSVGRSVPIRRNSTCGHDNHLRYLDNDDEEDTHANSLDQPQASPRNEHGTVEDDDDEEPMYLDDDSEDDEALPTDLGTKTYSFISMAGLFPSSKRLQEHAHDPCLIARLQRARARGERQRLEEQMRLSRVLAVITPLRARATRVAAERGTLAFETPGVE